MSDLSRDRRDTIDAQINTPGREGLAGTAPANLYGATLEREQITIAPDFAPPEAQPAWRQDFPIDWPQDQYVERRDFVKFMVLTSAAFTLGQVWIGLQNWYRKHAGDQPRRRIASVDEVAIGGALTFAYPDEHGRCLLVRTGENTLVAYSQSCTHLACAVVPRFDEQRIHCPCHEGYFDLASGRPIAGPPQRPLARIQLDVKQGAIYATGVEARTV